MQISKWEFQEKNAWDICILQKRGLTLRLCSTYGQDQTLDDKFASLLYPVDFHFKSKYWTSRKKYDSCASWLFWPINTLHLYFLSSNWFENMCHWMCLILTHSRKDGRLQFPSVYLEFLNISCHVHKTEFSRHVHDETRSLSNLLIKSQAGKCQLTRPSFTSSSWHSFFLLIKPWGNPLETLDPAKMMILIKLLKPLRISSLVRWKEVQQHPTLPTVQINACGWNKQQFERWIRPHFGKSQKHKQSKYMNTSLQEILLYSFQILN